MDAAIPPQDGPMDFAYPQSPQDDMGEGSLKYQLDSNDLIKKLRQILLGFEETKNEYGKTTWVQNESRQLITTDGMNFLEPVLRGYLDKIFILSDLEQEQVENMTLSVESDLRDIITMNYLKGNKWKIRNLATASTIKNIICSQVFATLSKAKHRGFQQYLRTIARIQEVQAFKGSMNQYDRPEQSQAGGMGNLPIVGRFFK